ncbi:MAG: SprT-like domain-containing protein [Rhodoluna sp.]
MAFQDELLAPLLYDEDALKAMLTKNFNERIEDSIKTFVDINDLPTISRLENVGFQTGRQFNKGKTRYVRLSCDRYDFVRMMAETKMAEFLDMDEWKFQFDSAKRRAGQCNYSDRVISISRYLVDIHDMDESEQVVLHEIAHAISGASAGHGRKWLANAKRIGYRAEKFTGQEIAVETATWVGYCPNGHVHYRYRRPKYMLSCALCESGFNAKNLIRWRHRDEVIPNYQQRHEESA